MSIMCFIPSVPKNEIGSEVDALDAYNLCVDMLEQFKGGYRITKHEF